MKPNIRPHLKKATAWAKIVLLCAIIVMAAAIAFRRLFRHFCVTTLDLALLSLSTESLIAVCFNTSLLKYGDDLARGRDAPYHQRNAARDAAAVGLFRRAAIVSYNYGAQRRSRTQGVCCC